jgi:hypothetical protein
MKIFFLITNNQPTEQEWESLKKWKSENKSSAWRRGDKHPIIENLYFNIYSPNYKNGESWLSLDELEKNRKRTREWQDSNRDKVNETARAYWKKRLDEDPNYRYDSNQRYIAGESFQEAKEGRRVKAAKRRKSRRSSDILFRFRDNISSLIRVSLKKVFFTKKSKTQDILGVHPDEFKLYIESLFEPWMNWDNYGGGHCPDRNTRWEIDHIVPISTATTEEEALKLNHYSNLRPLCVYENRVTKRAKLI